MECMKIHTVDHNEAGRAGVIYSKTHHLHGHLPERPLCWLLGHQPTVHSMETSYSGTVRWIECKRCLRRPQFLNQRTAGLESDGVRVDWDGLLEAARDAEWSSRDVGSHIQVHVQKPRPEMSLRLHLGGRGSETPIDAHASILGTGVYLGVGVGEKLAELLGPHRDLRVGIHDGCLRWTLWGQSDSTGARKPRWQEGWFGINPIDGIFGPKRCDYRTVDQQVAVLALPDGEEHTVVLKLQRRTIGRKRLKSRAEVAWVVDWEAPDGIPVYVNRGWKGNDVYASDIEIDPFEAEADVDGPAWVYVSLMRLRDWVLRERERTGWTREATA